MNWPPDNKKNKDLQTNKPGWFVPSVVFEGFHFQALSDAISPERHKTAARSLIKSNTQWECPNLEPAFSLGKKIEQTRKTASSKMRPLLISFSSQSSTWTTFFFTTSPNDFTTISFSFFGRRSVREKCNECWPGSDLNLTFSGTHESGRREGSVIRL